MKKTVLTWITDILYIIVGSLIFSISVNTFCVPNSIIVGGITGFASVLNITVGAPIGLVNLAANIIIFIFAFFLLNRKVVLKSFVAVVISSVIIDVSVLIPFFPKYEGEPILATIFGGITGGIGLGIIFLRGITTGGVDAVALMLEKAFPSISYGTLIIIQDVLIIALTGIVFRDVTLMLYSVISVWLTGAVVDRILDGADSGKLVYIVTQKPDEICADIFEILHRGVTRISASGAYTSKDVPLLMIAIRARELVKLKKIVKEADDSAFMIIGNVVEVDGKGFKRGEKLG